MAIVETHNLSKIYGAGEVAVTALDRVSISVEPGEFVAVMGPSGCGKSTLLHLLGGLDSASDGSVLVDGQDLAGMKDEDLTRLRRRKIGFVFQFFNLIPVLTALENVALPVTLDGVRQAEARTRAGEWLTRLGMAERMDHRPDQLSGGQQQRVAIARALVADPDLILAAIGVAFGLLAGLYLGYTATSALSAFGFPMDYAFPASALLVAIAAGLIFGVLAALIPARQAAGLPIVSALRYE